MSWEENEQKNKRNGIITSLGVHGLLLLLFLFWGWTSAYPPTVEGILINFGTMDAAGGDQPSFITEEPEKIAPQQSTPPQPEPQVQEEVEIATQDVVEAPAIPKKEEKKDPEKKPEKPVKEPVKTVQEEVKQPVKEEPKADPKSMYTGKVSDVNAPSNEGIYQGPGDQGDPNGGESDNYVGKSYGLGNTGVGYDLTGRSMLAIPPIEEEYRETGKVVVSIKVDRNGRVISAKYTVKGSTTSDPKLIALAEKAAREAKFSTNTNAPEEQFGSISFTFKLK